MSKLLIVGAHGLFSHDFIGWRSLSMAVQYLSVAVEGQLSKECLREKDVPKQRPYHTDYIRIVVVPDKIESLGY